MSKILALTPFHIYPPTFGGAERCWNLLSNIGPCDVIALNWDGHNAQGQLGDVNYQLIAADAKAVQRATKLRAHGVQTFDPMPSLVANDLTTIRRAIDESNPDLIILEHPWLIDLIDGRPYIYDAHNNETANTRNLTGATSYDADLVADIEKRTVQNAEHMTYCSLNDIETMAQTFDITTSATLIPNGVTLPEQVAAGNSRNLIFIGSAYGPNIRAAQTLINLAPALHDYTIQILGKCANYLTASFPNVQLVGEVTEQQMHHYFVNAHAFINMTTEGSGTHLKIGRALAYGLPVITTALGSRGYTNTIKANLHNVVSKIRELNWRRWHHLALAEAETLNWNNISKRFRSVIHEHL